ncbi:MAG TPA: selenium metabolism-associated LysR family transcriptional regulator [Dissulfurispiraceae bacterium]|nr:selenium metabolism-associated LysR family transcriptional regulator [Dissulfurispiraceae bacterium]
MEDHKLKVFCTVAETKSFSKTSEIIHLTQPAVSLQVQALEDIYDTKLFDRTSGSINLTTSGEVLYKYAKDILALYALAEKDISKITGLVKGSIKVGAGTTFGNHILPSVIVDFKNSHPKIEIDVFIGNTKRIMDLLHSGAVDVGIVGEVPSKSKVVVEPIMSDELFLIVPPQHPWAKKKIVSVAEIVKEPIVFREEGSGTRQVIEKFLADNGVNLSELHIAVIMGSTSSIKEAVERGMGISVVSKWAIRKEVHRGHLKAISPKEGRIVREFSLVIPKNTILPHAVDEFITFLKSYSYDRILSENKTA